MYSISQFVIGEIGNLRLGGIIIMITKRKEDDSADYTILNCGLSFVTNKIIKGCDMEYVGMEH